MWFSKPLLKVKITSCPLVCQLFLLNFRHSYAKIGMLPINHTYFNGG